MNRKIWLTIKLILLVFVFLILCDIAGSLLFSRSQSSGWTMFGFRHPENAALVKGREQAFKNVDKIIVQSASLPVAIYESDVEEVTVRDNTKSVGLKLGTDNSVEQKGGVLSIIQGKQIALFSIMTGNLEIEIPRGTALEYDIKNVSGSVFHDAPSRNELEIKSVSGSIRILQGGKQANATTQSGSIRIYAPFEEVRAQSTSGSVRTTADGTSREMTCSSISGSVKIQLNQVSGYVMKYSTSSGTVKDTYTDNKYSKSGKCISGDGTLKIKASSVSGSVKLTDWE